MKQVILFHFEGCPFCRAARGWVDELLLENPDFAKIDIQRIDEKLSPEIARQYPYWYVPTFFVDGVKAHEGVCTKAIVERVLRSALD